jgi:hypothetical protein
MPIKPFLKLTMNHQLLSLTGSNALLKPFYQLNYLVAAKECGFLLLITCCQGGSLGVEVLNLWGAATLTGGRLPSKRELIGQLHQAGFQNIQTNRLIPGEALFAFKALP